MANFLQARNEVEIKNNDAITVLLQKILPDLSLTEKQAIVKKCDEFNISKIEDFILLEGFDEKIVKICSACPNRPLYKLATEITRIVLKKQQELANDDNTDDKSVADGIEISVSPFENIDTSGNADIAVVIKAPDSLARRPVDLCCVIDTSGSMGEYATSQDPEDKTKTITHTISVLDLVKFGVKTIIRTLTEQDRLSIVAFNSEATTAFRLSKMGKHGEKKAIQRLDKLKPGGSTNMWAGLFSGLESLRIESTTANIPRKSFLLLLTDGQPIQSPQNGEDGALKQYFETYPAFKCQVNTFGFGYSLNSKLLLDVAVIGNGVFGFIPDAKIIGTCFVNAVANFCSTLSQNCVVRLRCCNGSSFADDAFGEIKLSPIQFGQHRDFIVPMKNIQKNSDDTYLEVILEYENNNGAWRKRKYNASSRIPTGESMNAFVRNKVVKQVNEIVEDCLKGRSSRAIKNMTVLKDEIAALETMSIDNKYNNGWDMISAIKFDVWDRIEKAFSSVERFKRWGAHYLRALMRAYQLQLCSNNMDEQLQKYRGQLFNKLVKEGGEIFQDIEKQITTATSKQNVSSVNVQDNCIIFNNRNTDFIGGRENNGTTFYGGVSGGCFASDSTVTILQQDHTHITTQIKNVRKYDMVRVIDGYAKVLCVVQIEMMSRNDKNALVELKESGLKITPKHPVYFNDRWCLPADLISEGKAAVVAGCDDAVYNLVLDRCHVLLVNDIPCVTFGHGLVNNPVTYDNFYATHHVIDFLNKLPGSKQGFIKVYGSLKKMWQFRQQKQNNNMHQQMVVIPASIISS